MRESSAFEFSVDMLCNVYKGNKYPVLVKKLTHDKESIYVISGCDKYNESAECKRCVSDVFKKIIQDH